MTISAVEDMVEVRVMEVGVMVVVISIRRTHA
jgi:hypothetical protein